jgi:formylglycine-generating enzyme required for sulfatase activity
MALDLMRLIQLGLRPSRPPGKCFARWPLAFALLLISCLASNTAFAQAIPALPAEVKSAKCWTSGDPAVGAAEVLSPADSVANSDVEDFIQGNLDVSHLEPGTHRIPVRITDANGVDGGIFWLDVVVFEPSWEPSQQSVDEDGDGLPDRWEQQYFSGLGELAESDSDDDGLSNLDELRLGSDPTDALSPANRVVRAEVFINEDPGEGRAFPMSPKDGLLESAIEDIELPNYLTRYLPPGRHILGIRVQRETGEWSEVRQADLIVFEDTAPDAPEDFGIVEAEGFWEDLITPGAGTELPLATATGGNDVRDLSPGANMGSTGQLPGLNRAFYRFKSGRTGYGEVLESLVQVQDPDPMVGEVPFFVDSLFGVENDFGLGTELIGIGFDLRSPWWTMQESLVQQLGGLTSGGLSGEYFSNTSLSGIPARQRIDATVDFDWGTGGPFEGMSENFSVRWTGFIIPQVTGSYTFQVTGDDGVRLWVGDSKLIDGWQDQAPTTYTSGAVALVAGTAYPVTMEYFENGGGAVARLYWKGPQDSSFAPIPASVLNSSGGGMVSMFREMPMLGWIGTGDVSAFGTGNSLNVNLQTGGTLTWLWGDATFAVTFEDDQGRGSGKGLLPRYGMVTSSVPEIVYQNPDTRLVCLGWQATGSGLTSGTTNSVTYRLTGDTNIRWLWKTQHRVRIETRHGTVDGWEEWYDAGTQTALIPRADEGYEFEAWSGGITGTGTPGAVSVNTPLVVGAKFRPTQSVQLTVVQIDGTRSISTHVRGEIVDLQPSVVKVENGNTRDVANGWRAEGAIYDSGNGSRASLALTRDTTLYWLPTRQYRLQPVIVPQGAGTVRIEGRQSTADVDWYDAGPIRLIAKHNAGNRFVDWYLQNWNQREVSTILSAELPLVARFAKVEALGDFAPVDGGPLTSPNSAVSHFRSFIPSAKMKRTEVTTAEYCAYLNWAVQAGYIETPNHISVRGANPLADYTGGLKAEWFRGEDWTVEPEFRNIVSSLNLDFGAGSPSQITNGTPNCAFTETDFFSFRLRGQIYSTRTGKISLKEFCDDKVKIIFRGALVLDNTDPNTNAAVQVDAVTGWNDIEFVFVELTNLAKFKVQWDPNGSTAWQDIPSGVLRHKRLADSWASTISTYEAAGFREDLELVDLDTVDCNIELVSGVFQPKAGQGNYPLVDVTWHGAMAYCQWLAEATGQPVALPDEWLWEYAASGGNSTSSSKYYPWGPLFLGVTRNNANYTGSAAGFLDVYEGLSPVGTFPAYQGLRDMAGNVFEWTSTRYEQGDPIDPFMVLRGGSWNQPTTLLANSYRLIYKNQYFSDKATGFRPAVVNQVDFSVAGFVEVPTSPVVTSPNSARGDYAAPTERYQLSALEVTNSEYARFLNQASSGVLVQDEWVMGNSPSTNAGKRLLLLTDNNGIEVRGNLFVAVPGHEGEPVTNVTWYGADAYCRYLSELVPTARYALANQWQWENAMLRALEPLDQEKVNYSLKDLGVTKAGSFGADVRYGTGFWPGFYDAAGNVQEWTSSAPAIDMTDRAVLRGGAFNLESLFVSFTKADQHAGLEEARPNLGFRPAITAMAPKVEGLFEKVVMPTSGSVRKLAFAASSFRQNPSWTWQKVAGPSWATLADLGSGRCQVTLTPPSAVEEAVMEFSVSDGLMTSYFSVPLSIVAGGAFQIEGLPNNLTVRDGEEATEIHVRAIPSGTTGASVTWSVTNGAGKVSVESTGPLTGKLTVLSGIVGTLDVALNVTDGSKTGSAGCMITGGTPPLEFVDFPELVSFEDNRTSIQVSLEARGGSVGGASSWSVASAVSSWARIVSQNGASAILEIDRDGFASTGTIPVTYTDGITSVIRNVEVREAPSAPRLLLPAPAMQFVAGTPFARVLVTAEDRNAADTLSWTVEPASALVSIVPVNGRSAEIVINTTNPFPVTSFTIRASDGALSASGVIQFSVVNSSPVIAGPEGLQEFDVGGGPYEMGFTVSDADRGQNPRIEVVGSAPWFTWRHDGKDAIRVTIAAESPSEGSVTISATDGLTTVTRDVPVRVRRINGTPGIDGLPAQLHLARFSAPVRLPFTLTDNDENDRLSVALVFPVAGVQILMDGQRSGRLLVDPVQSQEAIPILLEVTDSKEKTRSSIQLTLGEGSPDGHKIAAAEYFFDSEPSPGEGIPVPASNNEPYNDTASFARLAPVLSTLNAGWHRIGIRFRTVAGQWSSTRWQDVHVYDDAPRDGIALTRPDGDLAYSRWPGFNPVAGTPGTVPGWGSGFEDQNPGQGAGTNQNLVFEDNDGIESIESAIVWAEYFIDSDPGPGNAARLPMDRRGLDSTLTQIQFDLDTSQLSVGLHRIGLRCRMANGTWGETKSLSFYVFEDYEPTTPPKAEVVDAEYIWNGSGSPGFGNGLLLDQATAATEIGVVDSQPVQTAPLDTGDHQLHLRFKNQGDEWGETRRWGITVAAPDGSLNLANLHVESNIGIPFLNYDSWQLIGSTIFLHVPQVYWVNDLVYANFGFIGQGSVPSYGEDNSVSFVMTGASDLTWIWGRDCEVVSRSEFAPVTGSGNWQWFPDFNAGYGVFVPLELVSLSVPESVSIATGTRQHCTGWTGTGSAPTSGKGNQVEFVALARNSEVDWIWRKEHALTVEIAGEGQVFGNDGWVAEGASETLTAIPNPGHRFVRWEVAASGSAPSATILMDSPKTVRAVFSEHRVWVVDPVSRERNLVGVFEDGAEVSLDSPQSIDVGVGSRLVVTGWTGAGSAAGGGVGTNADFTIHADSEIRWAGVRQHWVGQRVNQASLGSIVVTGPRVVAEGSWFDEGVVSIEATTSAGGIFARWLGDLDGASRKLELNLNAPVDAAVVFRSTVSPPALVEVPAGVIASSPNTTITGFESRIAAFRIAQTETTTGQMVAELNRAMAEGSIRVEDSRVVARRELVQYSPGLSLSWRNLAGDILAEETILELDGVPIRKPSGQADAQDCVLEGQIYLGANSASGGLSLMGQGAVRLWWNGQMIAGPVNLPVWLPLSGPMGWGTLRLQYTPATPDDSLTMGLTDSSEEPVGLLSGPYIRHLDRDGAEPVELIKGMIGASAVAANTFSSHVVSDGSLSIDSQAGDLWFAECGGDFDMSVTVARPATGKAGLMVRQGLRVDSRFVEVSVSADGRLRVNDTVLGTSSRTNWKLRISRRGVVVICEFQDLDGKWKDASSGTLEARAHEFDEVAGMPAIAGLYASNTTAAFSGFEFKDLSRRFNRQGQVLLDLGWPGATITFDGTTFAAKAGSGELPVVCVTHDGAAQYAEWLEDRLQDGDYGLPSEWEFEYLSGGREGMSYPWGGGNESPGFANLAGAEPGFSQNLMAPVASYASINGIYDLIGNAWEWTLSDHRLGHGAWKNIRGASFRQPVESAASSFRLFYGRQSFVSNEVGFRVVRRESSQVALGRLVGGSSLDLASASEGLVRGFESPSAEYSIGSVEVSCADYSAFLNALEAQGKIAITDGWVVSNDAAVHFGRRFLMITGNAGIQRNGTQFSAIQGKGGLPVTMVTWYGADAFGRWLTNQSVDWAFRLPSEWEWEAAAGSGYSSASSQLAGMQILNQKGAGDSLLDSATLRWGIGGLVSSVAEWTLSEAIGMPGLMTVRGGVGDWYSGVRDPASRVEYLDADSAASHIGFRLVRVPKEEWKSASTDGTWTAAVDPGVLDEGGAGTLVLSRSGDPSFEHALTITSSDSRIGLPATVVFAPGESVRIVNFEVATDAQATGDLGARITIQSEYLSTASLDVLIRDQAVPELFVSHQPSELRSGASVSLRFSRNGSSNSPLSVRLSGSAVAAFGLPSSLVIPAGNDFVDLNVVVPFVAQTTSYQIEAGADWYLQESAQLEVLPSAASAYDTWIFSAGYTGDDAERGATPQNDGVANILKFAFNLDPSIPDVRSLVPGAGHLSGLPCAAVSELPGGGKALVIEYIRRKASTNPGITYRVQFSSDLQNWVDESLPEIVEPINATWERVFVTDNPPPGSSRRMGRVNIQ